MVKIQHLHRRRENGCLHFNDEADWKNTADVEYEEAIEIVDVQQLADFVLATPFHLPGMTSSSGAKAEAKMEKIVASSSAHKRPFAPPNRSFVDRASMSPVMEAETLMILTSTLEEDECGHEQANEAKDLERCEPEFRFAVEFDRQAIDSNDKYHDDSTPSAQRYRIVPILNNQTGGGNFGRDCNDEDVPLHPTKSEI